jgi:ABC-2 type transport system permease protein
MSQILRQITVIARRDFLAVVATPTFLLFLLAPFFMLSFGAIGGLGGSQIADAGNVASRIAIIAEPETGARLKAEEKRLMPLFRSASTVPDIEIIAPKGEPDKQMSALIADPKTDMLAVMRGPFDHPTILHSGGRAREAAYLSALAENLLGRAKLGDAQLSKADITEVKRNTASKSGAQAAGAGAVFVIFLLTLLLAGQTVGMMAEEKANKVIEILAAAVPLEAVFFGKLIGMFGVSLLFIAFWGSVAAIGISVLPDSINLSSVAPAIGVPTFLILGALYFSMAYMILGAVFLGVGAQASTMREIQMLSLPITLLQVGMFGLSTAAAGNPGSKLAQFAEWFPFSSPFAMAAHGATDAALWPHLIALVWQALWVGVIIWLSAKLFRRGVLKSGGGWRTLFARRSA